MRALSAVFAAVASDQINCFLDFIRVNWSVIVQQIYLHHAESLVYNPDHNALDLLKADFVRIGNCIIVAFSYSVPFAITAD